MDKLAKLKTLLIQADNYVEEIKREHGEISIEYNIALYLNGIFNPLRGNDEQSG